MKMKNNKKGFTLIELILVIGLLGILAISALPSIFNISLTDARTNSRDAVVGAVQSGLSLFAANQVISGGSVISPALFESADLADDPSASRTTPLFNQVLQNGAGSQWVKVDDDCYAHDTNGNSTFNDGVYLEYQYSSGAGTFLGVADCGA